MTVKLLEAMVKDLQTRVGRLEHVRKRRLGFEYEGNVGGDVVQSTYYEAGGPGEDKARE
jgi:hypothetical protein